MGIGLTVWDNRYNNYTNKPNHPNVYTENTFSKQTVDLLPEFCHTRTLDDKQNEDPSSSSISRDPSNERSNKSRTNRRT